MAHRWSAVPLLVLIAMSTAARADERATAPAAPTTAPATRPTTRPAELLTVQPGDLPIILSAPHGGKLPIPDAARRTGDNFLIKKGVKANYSIAFDGNVDVVAHQLADELERRTGKRPYLVVANFSRRYVDANRTPEEAYESEAGRAVYERYHAAIRQFRTEVIRKWQRGLLIDIHGHGRDPATIIRGTADWASVRHLVEEFGKEAIVGPDGLLGPLAAAGNKLVPPNDGLDEPEFKALNGGFITRTYGSFAGGNFDAIQFELGGKFRKAENIPTFVSQTADGLVPFTNRYLLVGPTTAPATKPVARPATRPAAATP